MDLNSYCGICLVSGVRSFHAEQYPFLNNCYQDIISEKMFCYECSSLLVKFTNFKQKCWRGLDVFTKLYSREYVMPAIAEMRASEGLSSNLGHWNCTDNTRLFEEQHKKKKVKMASETVDEFDDEYSKVNLTIKNEPMPDLSYLDVPDADDSNSDFVSKTEGACSVDAEPLKIKPDHEVPVEDTVFAYAPEYGSSVELSSIAAVQSTKSLNANRGRVKIKKKRLNKVKDPKGKEAVGVKEIENFKLIVMSEKEVAAVIEGKRNSDAYKKAVFKCELCYMGFNLASTLQNHMAVHDVQRGSYLCKWCQKRFKSNSKLNTHVNNAHRLKAFCMLCSFVTFGRNAVHEHLKRHNNVTYICEFCNKSFSKSTSFLSHKRVKHRSGIVCPSCGASFLSRNGLNIHYQRSSCKPVDADVTHEEKCHDKELYCDKCKVQFTTAHAYSNHKIHSVNHANETGREPSAKTHLRCSHPESICPSCGLPFSVQSHLKYHMKECARTRADGNAEVGEDGGLFCKLCNIQFSNKVAYDAHLWHAIKHRNIERLPDKLKKNKVTCPICQSSFSARSAFTAHCKQEHVGYDYYERSICEICGALLMSCNMPYHMARHDGQSFQCDTCHKAFTFKRNLIRHLGIHRDERPYQCEYCSHKFHQKRSLEDHIKFVHLRVPYPKRVRARRGKALETRDCDSRRKWWFK